MNLNRSRWSPACKRVALTTAFWEQSSPIGWTLNGWVDVERWPEVMLLYTEHRKVTRIWGFSPASAGRIQELTRPNSGVSLMSIHVYTPYCRPRVRNSGLFQMPVLLAGDHGGHSITYALNMSPRPSDCTRFSASYTKASTRSLRVQAV